MAAAHVTGGLALCASADRHRSPRALRALLLDTATPTASLTGRTVTGGRLDVGRLLARCAPAITPKPTPEPIPVPVKVQVDELDASFKRKGKGWSRVYRGIRGHHYRLPVRGDERVSHGAWRPILAAPGTYRVAAYIPIAPDASHGAVYKIMTADGWVVAVRNQHKRQGRWMSLGIHELTTTPSVRLADLTMDRASLDRYLVYDAVRFVPYP